MLHVDPEVGVAMAALAEAGGGTEPPPAGDWKTRRELVDGLLGQLALACPEHPEVVTTSHPLAVGGDEIELRQYVTAGAAPRAAVLYLHGGGMICGSVDLYDRFLRDFAARVPEVTFLAVDYRLAPEHPHPTPVEDCYTALVWIAGHAGDLGVDAERLAVAGDSAGGGLAAAVALVARDRGGPALARQILTYPMLDDRSTVIDPLIAPYLLWSYDDNITGWEALLGHVAGGDDISAYAAPARAIDVSGLPSTFIDVGDLDLFRDEDLLYARRLSNAGVPVELHLYPGVPHAFERLAPESDVARRALADRCRAFRALAG